jgi:hypothetical protein
MHRKDATARKEYAQQYLKNNADKLRAYHAAYRVENKEKIAEKRKLNAEEHKKYAKEYRATNKENVSATKKKYVESNRSYINSYVAKRKAEKLQRTPKWLTEIDLERINNEYKFAEIQSKMTGESWHVDHIIPLQGEKVSGLHVPSNLQAIRGVENWAKNNSFEVNYA